MSSGVSAFAVTVVVGILWGLLVTVRVLRTGALRAWDGRLSPVDGANRVDGADGADGIDGSRQVWDTVAGFRLLSGPVLLMVLGFTPAGSALVRVVSPASIDAAGVLIGALVGGCLALRVGVLRRLRRPLLAPLLTTTGAAAGRRLSRRLRPAVGLAAAGAVYGYLFADSQSPVTYTAALTSSSFDPGSSALFEVSAFGGSGPKLFFDGTTVATGVLVLGILFAFSDRLLFNPRTAADAHLTGCVAYVAGLFRLAPPRVVITRRASVALAAVSPGWRPVVAFRAETRQTLPSAELTWVTAHEMAHIAHRHGYLRVAGALARVFSGLALVALLADGDRLTSLAGIRQPPIVPFGFSAPDLQKLPLQAAILALWLLVTRPVELFALRREEAFADQEAERVVPGHGVSSLDAVARLVYQPRRTYLRDRLLWLSHPSPSERRSRLARGRPDPA